MNPFVDLVARNLGVSRTAARRLLAEGRVTDNGGHVVDVAGRAAKAATRGGDSAGSAYAARAAAPPRPGSPDPLPREVWIDGDRVELFRSALVLLHKPTGVVTALRDGRHETAYALLRDAPLFAKLRPVGRLDLDTSGLLLWSTDGAVIQKLTHPKRRVPRTYHAALARPFAPPSPELTLEDGHRPQITEVRLLDDGERHPGWHPPTESACLAAVTIVGGAYHEVRRIFAALDSHVLALCRVRFGDTILPADLAPGEWRLAASEPASGAAERHGTMSSSG